MSINAYNFLLFVMNNMTRGIFPISGSLCKCLFLVYYDGHLDCCFIDFNFLKIILYRIKSWFDYNNCEILNAIELVY